MTKTFILDVWQGSRYTSVFSSTQSWAKVLQKKIFDWKMFDFCFCWKLVLVSISNARNNFTFQKINISSLALNVQRITHPPISVHMTLIAGRINIGKCRKIFISLNRMRVQSHDMRVQSRDIFTNSFLCIITKHFNSVDISVKTFTGSNDCL